MTTIQLSLALRNYHPAVFNDMMDKLHKIDGITITRPAPLRIQVICKTRSKYKVISRKLSVHAKILALHITVPSRIVNKRYFEYEAFMETL